MAVAAAVAAADGGVQHADGAAAVKGGVLVNDALLQRRRQRQRLEGGARLIGVVDGLVAPLTQLRPRQIQLAVFHHRAVDAFTRVEIYYIHFFAVQLRGHRARQIHRGDLRRCGSHTDGKHCHCRIYPFHQSCFYL